MSRVAAIFTTARARCRDVVQNHLLQVLTNIAMEPPPGLDVEMLRDEKAKVLKGIRPLRPQDVVRGQFRGYRDEPGVKADSQTETFVALRLEINSWRWKGVPFYIRAGKSLPVTATEVIVKLRQPPAVFTEVPLPANYFRFRVTPDLMIAVGALVKEAGEQFEGQQVELVICQQSDPAEMGAYEELLLRRDASGIPAALRARTMSKRHGGSSIQFWMMRLRFTSTSRAHGGRHRRAR